MTPNSICRQLGTDRPNRIIELDWAVKHNKEFVPTPKPPRKEKKRKGRRGGRKPRNAENNTAAPEDDENVGMQMEEDSKPISRNHDHGHKLGSSSATEFGMEITNTTNGSMTHGGTVASGSSPRLSKRLFTDVEDDNRDRSSGDDRAEGDLRTPTKKAKLADLGDQDSLASEDEVEVEVVPQAPLKGKAVAAST